MNPIETLVKLSVRQYNSSESAEAVYISCVRAAASVSLQHISREDVERVVRPFLYRWGRMGRTLGQRDDWETQLAAAVSASASLLQRYRTAELAKANLDSEEQHIRALYRSFKNAVGQVAAAKCLHLFCPHFFPMWDTTIATAAGRERGAKGISDEDFTADDYYQFTRQVRDFILAHQDLLSELAGEYGKTVVKIVDEVLWWATRRPLFLLLGANIAQAAGPTGTGYGVLR